MVRELKAKLEGRKDLKNNKFQATAENFNGENDKVSSNEYRSLRFEIDFFESFAFSLSLFSC